MKKLVFALLAIGLGQSIATADEASEAASEANAEILGRESQLLEQQQEALEREERPSGLDVRELLNPETDLPPATADCIELDRVRIEGASLLDEWELEVFEAPFIGECITPELATSVLAKATNFYISRGFITSRAYLPNQDLSDGVLTMMISEGVIEEIVAESEAEDFAVGPTLMAEPGDIVNIRDLEQAVDQLNKVPGNDVTMRVEPGEREDSSRVIFENAGKPGVAGRVSLDNSGSEGTGELVAGLSLRAGDLLDLSEVWSLSLRDALESEDRTSSSGSASVAFPIGYYTLRAGRSYSEYKTC